MNPIPAKSQEALILEYIRLRYLRTCGKINKLYLGLRAKADELGMSLGYAWQLVNYGRKIGMIGA